MRAVAGTMGGPGRAIAITTVAIAVLSAGSWSAGATADEIAGVVGNVAPSEATASPFSDGDVRVEHLRVDSAPTRAATSTSSTHICVEAVKSRQVTGTEYQVMRLHGCSWWSGAPVNHELDPVRWVASARATFPVETSTTVRQLRGEEWVTTLLDRAEVEVTVDLQWQGHGTPRPCHHAAVSGPNYAFPPVQARADVAAERDAIVSGTITWTGRHTPVEVPADHAGTMAIG